MAMLNALQDIAPDKARTLLAAAARVSADATRHRGETDASPSSSVFEILSEVRERVGLAKDDASGGAVRAVNDFLLRALRDTVMTDDAELDALNRAANAGHLSPEAYKVVQADAFLKQYRPFGVQKSTVEKAVLHPDDFQHLMVGDRDDGVGFSLFVKQFQSTRLGPHWLLVQANRRGIEQHVTSAWWIYPSWVDTSKVSRPLDLLKAFLDEFGQSITMAGKTGKYIEDVVLQKRPGEPAQFQVQLRSSVIRPDVIWTASNRVNLPDSTFRVGIGYCVDVGKYRVALKAKGAL